MSEVNRAFGRIPSPADSRDFPLRDYITLGHRLRALLPVSKTWPVSKVLDQGETGHCVGFACAGFGIAEPVADPWDNSAGDKIYYLAKVIDGEPNAEDGTTVRSGARALQKLRRLHAYAFARTVGEVKTWVLSKGTLVVGTDWYESMMETDGRGYVRPGGRLAGGHAYLLIGYDAKENAFVFQNSWGKSWGKAGRFKMKVNDFARLLSMQGEALTAVEAPV
ncbi:MAG: hypothetical protein M1482_10385 [Chloroflexi bacterium]|nr:hypothetical protein [Chloroflexota bacterium]